MAERRTKFGLRDCATDDEAASGKQDSDSLEEFSDSDDSEDVRTEATSPKKSMDSGKPVLDRELSWGRDSKAGDSIVNRLESVRILEKPREGVGSKKMRGDSGNAAVEQGVGVKEQLGGNAGVCVENGKVRQRRTESWADMIDGDDDEDEFDAVIHGWAAGSGELEKQAGGEESDNEPMADDEPTNSFQGSRRKEVVPKSNEPYNVPTSGTFYLHDDRWEEQPMRGRGHGRGRGFQSRVQKWKHDKFEELEKVLDCQRRQEKNTKGWKKKSFMNTENTGHDPKQKTTRQPNSGPFRSSYHAKNLGGYETIPPTSPQGLPQGVLFDQLKVARGGKRISHRSKGGQWHSCDSISSLEHQGERTHGVEKHAGRANHRRRGSQGNQSTQQSLKNLQFNNRRLRPDENEFRVYHKRASSVGDRVQPKLLKGSDRADWRTPSADCPVKHQGRASNQKRESRLQSPNGNSQPQRTTSNGADAPLPRASYGVSRPTHRRGLSEGNWRQARLTTLGSTKFQLNPNALPFQKVSMNPDAAPFIPPDTIHACARSLSKGL